MSRVCSFLMLAVIIFTFHFPVQCLVLDSSHAIINIGQVAVKPFHDVEISEVDFNWSDDLSWNLLRIDAKEAWIHGFGKREITVAVLDTGVDFTHPDLVNASWINVDEIPGNGKDDDQNGYVDDVSGWDFQDDDADPMDEHGHGTFVSGILAARLNDHGIVGVAPNVSIMALRVLDERGLLYADQWDLFVKAIDYAIINGARIIVLSLESQVVPPPEVHDALIRAKKANILIVGATGNDGRDTIAYPAAYPEVLAVSAIDAENRVPSFVNRGNGTMIAAPGSGIRSTWIQGRYLVENGTSYAVPHVAGVAALLWSLNGSLTVDEVWSLLIRTATPMNGEVWDPSYGHGVLNATRAVLSLLDEDEPEVLDQEITKVESDFLGANSLSFKVTAHDDVALYRVSVNYTFDEKYWQEIEEVLPVRASTVTLVLDIPLTGDFEVFLVTILVEDPHGNVCQGKTIDLTENLRDLLSSQYFLDLRVDILVTMLIVSILIMLILVIVRSGRKRKNEG